MTAAAIAAVLAFIEALLFCACGLHIVSWQFWALMVVCPAEGLAMWAALDGTREEGRSAELDPDEPSNLVEAVQAAQQKPRRAKRRSKR